MVDLKQAIQSAAAFAQQIYGNEPVEVRVEEVDASQDSWFITLSFKVPTLAASTVAPSFRELLRAGERQYKVFTVDKGGGEVRSMKIRQLSEAV